MYLCSDGHDEICHEGKTCPACELVQEKRDLERQVERLQAEINDHECEVNE